MRPLSHALAAFVEASRPLALTPETFRADETKRPGSCLVSVAAVRQPQNITTELTLRAYRLDSSSPSAHTRLATAPARAAMLATFQALLDHIDAIPALRASPVRVMELATAEDTTWTIKLMEQIYTYPTADALGAHLDTVAHHLNTLMPGEGSSKARTPTR